MKKTSFMKRLSLSIPLFWLTLCCFILGQFIKSLKESDVTSLSLELKYFSLLLGITLLGLALSELFTRILKDAPYKHYEIDHPNPSITPFLISTRDS